MLCDYDEVVRMLKKSATPQVGEAEKVIRNLAMENIQMLSCLHNAIKDYTIQESTKQLSASYINSIIRQNIADYPSQQLYIFLKSFLTDPNIHIDIKKICHNCLIGVLQILQDGKYFLTVEKLPIWVQLVLQCSKSPYNNVWLCSCLLLQCFAEAQIDFRYLNELINNLLEPFLSVFKKPQLNPQQFILFSEFIKSWTIVFDKLIILSQDQYGNQIIKLIINICNNNDFCEAIFKIYQFAAGSDQTYVCINFQLQTYLTKINKFKDQAAYLHLRAITYMAKIKQLNSLIFKKTAQSINRLAKTINIATLDHNFLQLYECQQFLIELFKIFNCYIEIYPQVLIESWKVFITHTLYPIIKISQQQMNQFHQDPQNFIQLNDDCCEDKQYQTLKSEACKCIQIIVDKSNQFQKTQNQVMKFIFQNSIDSIKIHLGMIFNSNGYSPPLQIQTAFLILSLFSYNMQDHIDKVQQIRIIICDQRIKNLPHLQMCRVLIFLSYNYLQIFGNLNDGKHWIDFALAQKQNSTLRYCCVDFLFNISDKYYSDQMYCSLICKIQMQNPSNFFNLLVRLVESHIKKIPKKLILITIQKCLNKIYSDIQKKIKNTQQIIRCLHILRIIADIHVTSQNTQIKIQLWKITQFFQRFFSLSIEDQIVKIISTFVRTSSLPLQNYLIQILPYLISAFKKGQYYQTHYFIILNNYVVKQDITIIQPIFNVIKEGFTHHLQNLGQSPKKSVKKVAISHHLLILQNILALYGDKINILQFENLRKLSEKLFIQNKKKFFDKVLVGKSLNLIVLCHMYNYSKDTINLLLQYHDQQVYFNYDIKVLINCLKIQIFKEKDLVTIIQYLNILTRDQNLKYQNQKNKKKNNSSLKIIFQRFQDYQVILGFTTTPFMKVKDYPLQLNDILQTLKNKNNNLYSGMINSMTSSIKQKLQYICSLQSTETLERRKKLKIKGIKSDIIEEQQNTQIIHQGLFQNSSDSEEKSIIKKKRKRL